jgi:hypothetical protein
LYFAEHSKPQWEIGWPKVQKVILPNFDFKFFNSFNGQNLELRKTQKNLWESVWSRGGQPELVCGLYFKKLKKTQYIEKVTEFRRRNFFLGRGLATSDLEAEKAIFRLKKS